MKIKTTAAFNQVVVEAELGKIKYQTNFSSLYFYCNMFLKHYEIQLTLTRTGVQQTSYIPKAIAAITSGTLSMSANTRKRLTTKIKSTKIIVYCTTSFTLPAQEIGLPFPT